MNEKGLGVDMGHWNQDLRKADGYGFSQNEHDDMYVNLAQPLITVYQYKIENLLIPKFMW